MYVLVTGANGRQGNHLVQELLGQGHRVRGTDLQAERGFDHESYDYVGGDLLDRALVAGLIQDVDAVVHLAGLILYDDDQSRMIIDVNWRASFEILEAMAHSTQKFQRFIYASSGQVYPDNPDGLYLYNPIDENHPKRPMNYYGYAKQASEEMVWFFQRKWGIPGVCLRFSHIQFPAELIDPGSAYSGPRFFLNRRLQSFRELKDKLPEIEKAIEILQDVATDKEQLLLTCGMDGKPFELVITHPADITQGIILALEADNAVGESYNLGYPVPFNFGTMIPYMADKLDIPYRRLNLPLVPYRGVASVAKIQAQLGFQPQYDPFRMVDEAIQ